MTSGLKPWYDVYPLTPALRLGLVTVLSELGFSPDLFRLLIVNPLLSFIRVYWRSFAVEESRYTGKPSSFEIPCSVFVIQYTVFYRFSLPFQTQTKNAFPGALAGKGVLCAAKTVKRKVILRVFGLAWLGLAWLGLQEVYHSLISPIYIENIPKR